MQSTEHGRTWVSGNTEILSVAAILGISKDDMAEKTLPPHGEGP